MSNSDDVKPSAPPTLFGNEPDADATGQTRILASLEGRVPMAAKASARKPTGRYLGAGLVVVAAAALAGWLWLDPGADAPVSIQAGNPAVPAQPAAGAAAPAGQTLADNAHASTPVASPAPAESAQAVAENSQPQAATIVDADSSDPALDRLGKVDGAAAAGAVAGATTLAALTSLGAQSAVTRSKTDEVSKNTKATSTSRTATTVEKGAASTAANSKDKKAVAKSSTSGKSKTTRRKSPATAADPDAEVLAALLSQPEGKPLSTATAGTRSTGKARN
ncbi:conserved hypothetical protein [Cupriavidus taiwanensis]|uniref:Transmembrane protein n=1 Tax=Cupriavidus taiwanensis TaxID=164546 RepID=A0A975XBF0_9BURK|nr:hypothetical protein [Cupriavidus taiwanensis]SOY64107.1 conserved hypothetical protein [Cupriavidus taiwanensis]